MFVYATKELERKNKSGRPSDIDKATHAMTHKVNSLLFIFYLLFLHGTKYLNPIF